MKIALINTNLIKPPIAPIGLEYLAEALVDSGQEIEILDLCWEEDTESAILKFFQSNDFDLIGITLRNTDDCAYTTRQSFLKEFSDMVSAVRKQTDAPIVIGGTGFSIMPEFILNLCKADAGLWGDGEFELVSLARRIKNNKEWTDIPNLIWKQGNKWIRNSMKLNRLENLPIMTRTLIDNQRYLQEGGQIGFETKRGCPRICIYCADPVAKGKEARPRPPQSVGEEIENLLNMGIDYLHTCDSEFNIPEWHAKEICREIIRRNLGDKIHWYAYCSPQPFSKELAYLMRKAGCIGINFGVDHGDDTMLKRLKRFYTGEDILKTVEICKENEIIIMLDLLFGAPGETKSTLKNGIKQIKKTAADQIGIALGVRIYPGTELEQIVKKPEFKKGFSSGKDPAEPSFFLNPGIGPQPFQLLEKYIEEDSRFLFFNPNNPDKNYNYNANERLIQAIQDGYRGAYWDILRKIGIGKK